MKSCAIALLCLLLLAGSFSVSRADSKIVQHEQVTVFVEDTMYRVLGSKTFIYDYTSPVGPTQPGPLSLWFTLGYDSQPTKTLFGDVPLLSDVGQEICINAACAHPAYSTFVVGLTNGVNERLSGTFSLRSADGTVSSSTTRVYESSFWPTGGSKDFQGDRIGGICIRIDKASLTQVPVVVNAVPEPVSVLGLASGLGWLAVSRRKKSR